jgi:predicted LPLAT superfamily acyltransferase
MDIYKHFFTFASTIHDRIYLLNNKFDLFDIDLHGEQLIIDAMSNDQGILLIGAHIGSFEIIRSLAWRHTTLKVVMAMYEENARKTNQALAIINPEAQQDIIGLGHLDSILKLNEHLNAGTFVGILGDRSFHDDATIPISLLGSPANLPSGPFRIAAILQRPVIFMIGLYLGGNRYQIHFEKLADFSNIPRAERQFAIHRAMLSYATLLEKYCKSAPYNWFNFFNFWAPATSSPKQKSPRAKP